MLMSRSSRTIPDQTYHHTGQSSAHHPKRPRITGESPVPALLTDSSDEDTNSSSRQGSQAAGGSESEFLSRVGLYPLRRARTPPVVDVPQPVSPPEPDSDEADPSRNIRNILRGNIFREIRRDRGSRDTERGPVERPPMPIIRPLRFAESSPTLPSLEGTARPRAARASHARSGPAMVDLELLNDNTTL